MLNKVFSWKKLMQNNLKINWFDSYKSNITSQTGEDGVLKRVFELILGNNRWCCELWARNGKNIVIFTIRLQINACKAKLRSFAYFSILTITYLLFLSGSNKFDELACFGWHCLAVKQ